MGVAHTPHTQAFHHIDRQNSDIHPNPHIIHVCLNRLKKANSVTFTLPSKPHATTCRDMTCARVGTYLHVSVRSWWAV